MLATCLEFPILGYIQKQDFSFFFCWQVRWSFFSSFVFGWSWICYLENTKIATATEHALFWEIVLLKRLIFFVQKISIVFINFLVGFSSFRCSTQQFSSKMKSRRTVVWVYCINCLALLSDIWSGKLGLSHAFLTKYYDIFFEFLLNNSNVSFDVVHCWYCSKSAWFHRHTWTASALNVMSTFPSYRFLSNLRRKELLAFVIVCLIEIYFKTYLPISEHIEGTWSLASGARGVL